MVTEPSLSIHPAMASATSSNTTTIPSIPIAEKFSKYNYLLWHMQTMLAIRATRFEDLLLSIETALTKSISVRSGDPMTDKLNS
jgi:hypothetical protein